MTHYPIADTVKVIATWSTRMSSLQANQSQTNTLDIIPTSRRRMSLRIATAYSQILDISGGVRKLYRDWYALTPSLDKR